MAPISISVEPSAPPLADYFFISGLDSSSVFQGGQSGGASGETSGEGADGGLLSAVNSEQQSQSANGASDAAAARKAHARFSYEPRKSVGSINLESSLSPSNRSSATIRPHQSNGSESPAKLEDFDFEETLRKFASERDNFLEDIRFSAGQLAHPGKPRPKPKTQRIVNDDLRREGGSVGSLRRRISTMNPLTRTGTSARRPSTRNAKRMSGYNSVIPSPQRFKSNTHTHPLKRPYEPVLLDQYPTKGMGNEVRRRMSFPDYVPMFVFPNDINVVSADEKPRSTWHGFAMTSGDGSKLYGMCLITWMPLHTDASEQLEQECEQWRNMNMSNEEREMAKDLGERLANERAKLSELLADLAMIPSGTFERDAQEEEISAVEERISLMTDALRPVRYGAASKIDGLTVGETGFWIPRAYGILGQDGNMVSFWKEWLRAVVAPMTNGGVVRVPLSSPRVGLWQPLERYVINLCTEAPTPMTSITQVELSIRELRMYARKEAINEIPGSRNIDLYPLFRCLDVPDIVILFEYVLAESRIILLSSYTSMLALVSAAITQLLYPLKWSGVYIPVLPARLIQALEAPCPYIVGIERRYEGVELPEDDFVLVDLDQGVIEATAPPVSLPRQQRRKLMSILQLAAAHRYRFGVSLGPPKYAQDAYPYDAFASEAPSIFNPQASPSNLSHLANLNSTSFGKQETAPKPPVFNAFLHGRTDTRSSDRPMTGSTQRTSSPPSPIISPLATSFPPPLPTQPPTPVPQIPRNDSGYALTATLREKRSGVFDASSLRRKSSFGVSPIRRPSLPFAGHHSSSSISTIGTDFGGSNYAPSVYAQSTIAASTIMPHVLMQPVRNTESTTWSEGHCLQWRPNDDRTSCSVCDERAEDGIYSCSGCGMTSHPRCAEQICLVCPAAFHQEQITAAFARCFASLFYTYRKYLGGASSEQKKNGQLYSFNMDQFLRSVPRENADYMNLLRDTQAFQEFIHERETKRPDDPSIRLFDEIILSKRNRGRPAMFAKQNTNFLSDSSDHLWHTAAAPTPGTRTAGANSQVMGRVPAKLDPNLMHEPRALQGVPQPSKTKPRRKQVPSALGPGMK